MLYGVHAGHAVAHVFWAVGVLRWGAQDVRPCESVFAGTMACSLRGKHGTVGLMAKIG
jgi:hypothetical protein